MPELKTLYARDHEYDFGPFVRLRKWSEMGKEDYVLEYGVKGKDQKNPEVTTFPLYSKTCILDVHQEDWRAIHIAIKTYNQILESWAQVDNYTWIPKE